MTSIKVIIPAYNEANSIANVINDIPNIVDEVIVVNNNSTDNTEINAKNAGATVRLRNNFLIKNTDKTYLIRILKY